MKTEDTAGKRIAVLGAGLSGTEAARLLASKGALVTVLDAASGEALRASREVLTTAGIRLLEGKNALIGSMAAASFDLAVLSPGIDPHTSLVRDFSGAGVPLIAEIELAYQHCTVPVVAITGTNGKTTTTQLIECLFNGASVPTMACGNIGPAFSSKIHLCGQVAVMTVEVSSFQLERIETFRPRISVWLNFTPDHLDRYASMEGYFNAKLRIFENQTDEDWAVVNACDALPHIKARKITFSAYAPSADFSMAGEDIRFHGETVLRMSETRLRGAHNAENLMAAMGVGKAWGLSWRQMRDSLCNYTPLPHRCERVTTINGVEFVNDSKATNLDAMEKALFSENAPVVLIAGGKDKGFEFGSVISLVSRKCRAVVLIGEMAQRIHSLWKDSVECHLSPSLLDAVQKAYSLARRGDVVLFSPGTSSFDMFKNYADRGAQFRSCALEIAKSKNLESQV